MSRALQPVDRPEPDLIDRIAEALPESVRADYYREMRHCRSLPENDEMLRILRSMQFLTLLMEQAPARIASENERFEARFAELIACHRELHESLARLPGAIADGISPEAIAGRINENLRQQFVQSTIPQTAGALSVVATRMKDTTTDLDATAAKLRQSHAAANRAQRAIDDMESSICIAAHRTKKTVNDILGSIDQEHRWSIYTLCVFALILALALGAVVESWITPSRRPARTPTATVSTRK